MNFHIWVFSTEMSKVDYYHLKIAFLWLSHSLHITYREASFLSHSTYIHLPNSIFLKEKKITKANT